MLPDACHSAASTWSTNDQELVATVAAVPPPQAGRGRAQNRRSAAGGGGGREQRKGTAAAHLWPSPAAQFGVLPFGGLGRVPFDPVFASDEHGPPP